jgi:type II secretory pathway component PulM
MRETSRSGQLGELQRLLAALQVNQTEFPHLETQRAQLDALVGQAGDIFQSQAALAASKQEASQKLASLLTDSLRLATVLRFELKQFYGPTSEKLVEFSIQPFRGRKRRNPPPQPGESAAPAEAAPTVD